MSLLRKTIPLLILILLIAACNSEEPTATAVSEPDPTAEPTVAEIATAVPEPTDTPQLPTPTPQPPSNLVTGTDGFPWWNDTTFYQIYVRSFKDSNGDGIGDLNGVIEMLDYLNDGDPETKDDLGVTGIWLMPIQENPTQHPHGYHITDYYNVEEDYGTNEDFQNLVAEAHKRGIRVIVDQVFNHSAQENEWFVASKNGDPDKRDWYVWEETNPGYRGPHNQTVWHRTSDGYYYGVFNGLIPDFNLENPEVTQEIYDISQFWLEEMGADGFRLDAIIHYIEDGELQENTTATHEWLQAYHDFYKGINPDAYLVGEAWTADRQIAKYTGDEVDMAFQFSLAETMLSSANSTFAKPTMDELERMVRTLPPNQYANFLANHDQDRMMSQLGEDEGKARVAASLLFTAPGVPFFYYGDEIGMTGTRDISKPIQENNMRRPMQWSSDSVKVGFSEATPWRAVAPDYETRSVALQIDDPDSLLSHYRNLIHLRNENPALRVGEWIEVLPKNGRVYSAIRHTPDQTLLVLINLSSQEQTDYALNLEEGPLSAITVAELLMGDADVTLPEITETGGFSDYKPIDILPGHSTFVIQLTP